MLMLTSTDRRIMEMMIKMIMLVKILSGLEVAVKMQSRMNNQVRLNWNLLG